MSDYVTRRTAMVDTQIRPSDVTKFPIIESMLTVPREAYVPRDKREAAYLGDNLVIGGRVLLDPRTLAKMLDALDIRPNELVLDIACGLGYSSAVIARMAEMVIAVEDDQGLAEEAQGLLNENNSDNVLVQCNALNDGAPEHGPYDVMIAQGGIECFPETLSAQLKEGGRAACVFMEGALGDVRLGQKLDGKIFWRSTFNAAAPILKGFEAHKSFVF